MKKMRIGLLLVLVLVLVSPAASSALAPLIEAVDDFYYTDVGVILQVGEPGLLANDSGLPLKIDTFSQPEHGDAYVNSTLGNFAYDPDDDFQGTDTFKYCLSDGVNPGCASDWAIVTIYVGIAPPEPIPESTPSSPSCTRADVAVVIYGGWDGIPVNAYVGGTEQETLYTAHDAFGNPAVLWTFYPPATGWDVSVAPELPAGLDPARWQLVPVAIRTNGTAWSAGGSSATISPCSEHVFYFQLVDTGTS